MELKNCPFCGTNVHFVEIDRDDYIYIMCDNDDCLADMGPHHSKNEAIKAWNTRADGWVAVSERLPEGNAKVLIYTTEGVYLSATYTMYATKGFATAAGFYTDKVTHWRPLPSPPTSSSTPPR